MHSAVAPLPAEDDPPEEDEPPLDDELLEVEPPEVEPEPAAAAWAVTVTFTLTVFVTVGAGVGFAVAVAVAVAVTVAVAVGWMVSAAAVFGVFGSLAPAPMPRKKAKPSAGSMNRFRAHFGAMRTGCGPRCGGMGCCGG
ncbi:hypothetical protein ACIRP3_42485 [Streptomyces sp. NPDC101209]|uniref:hypothetical protein n=1 Tax=Streptomyces sp. NPDC101209 TaxID=3366129 RepID=UPI00380FFB04